MIAAKKERDEDHVGEITQLKVFFSRLNIRLIKFIHFIRRFAAGWKYNVFFFIELKVFVNLTYLYLSEIKKQGLIFSVGMGHLIIR